MIWLLACGVPDKDTAEVDHPSPVETTAVAGEDATVEIGTPLSFDASQSEGTTFTWHFGDGNVLEGSQVEHTYAQAGIYQAVLTVTGADGLQKTDSRKVTAHNPLLNPPPRASSTIAIHAGYIWAIFPEAGTLHQIDRETQAQEHHDICTDPRSLFASGNHIAIACEQELAVFDISTQQIEHILLPENHAPFGVAGSQNDWWITLSGTGELAHWDGESLTLSDLGPDPKHLTLASDGSLLSPRWRSGDDGGTVYHQHDGLIQTYGLDIDYAGDSDNTTGGIPNLLQAVVPSPDGTQYRIPMLHANILTGTYLAQEELKPDNTVRAMLATLSAEGEEEAEERKHFDEKGRSIAVAFSDYGDRIFVLHPAVQNISVLNAYTDQILGSMHDSGIASTGIDVDGDLLVVNAWLSRSIKAYETQSPYALRWEVPFSATDPVDPEVLWGKQIFNNAADTRMSKAGYMSCAHCHPSGSHDGQTWDFTDRGEGLRNTTSLLGASGTGMGPLHWTGNFDEIQDFEDDIRERFGGSGFLSDEEFELTRDSLGSPKAGLSPELDALTRYCESLDTPLPSPYPSPENGHDVFVAVGCAECHSAPLYTNSELDVRYDIGSMTEASGQRLGEELDGFDTPTLLG
ncbi:MAG: PKD domain-containing protein, partial [Myxococcota bacterium]|nr:PKD domain-containing protein [Myxococcota bacterium]